MPRLMLLAVLSTILLLAAGMGAQPPQGDSDPIGKKELPVPNQGLGDRDEELLPDPEDDGSGKERFWTRRYLRVINSSNEPITVFLQYRREVGGKFAWLPADPELGQALSFQLEPGQEQ